MLKEDIRCIYVAVTGTAEDNLHILHSPSGCIHHVRVAPPPSNEALRS